MSDQNQIPSDLAGLYRVQWYELYEAEVAYYNKIVSDPYIRRGITRLHDFFQELPFLLGRNAISWDGVLFDSWYEKTGLQELLHAVRKDLKGSKHRFPDGLFCPDVPLFWHFEKLKSLGFFSMIENYPIIGIEHSKHPKNVLSRNHRFIMRAFYYYLTGLKDIALSSGKECKSVRKTPSYEALLYFKEFDNNIFEMRKETWQSVWRLRDSDSLTPDDDATNQKWARDVAERTARRELQKICENHYGTFPPTYRTPCEVQTIESFHNIIVDAKIAVEDVIVHTPLSITCVDSSPHCCKLKSMASIWTDRLSTTSNWLSSTS